MKRSERVDLGAAVHFPCDMLRTRTRSNLKPLSTLGYVQIFDAASNAQIRLWIHNLCIHICKRVIYIHIYNGNQTILFQSSFDSA